MKGLIYKDIITNRPALIFTAILIIGQLIAMAFIPVDEGFYLLTVASTVWTYLLMSAITDHMIRSDVNVRWNIYAKTFPTASKQTVVSKYIVLLISYIICLLSHTASLTIAHSRGADESGIHTALLIFSWVLSFDSISYAFMFRFGPTRGSRFKGFFFLCIPCIAVLYGLFGNLSKLEPIEMTLTHG